MMEKFTVDEIEKRLDECFERLETLPAGDPETTPVIKEINELIEARNNLMKSDDEHVKSLIEIEHMKSSKKEKIVKYSIEAAKVLLPLGLYGFLTMLGFQFETNGGISSKFFSNVLNKIKPER